MKEKAYIKSPINYIGAKTQILPQIIEIFPKNIKNFFDIFCGGCNVGINISAEKIFLNDNLTYLMDMYSIIKEKGFDYVEVYIDSVIKEFSLSKENREGYNLLRARYNAKKYPLDLFVLIAYSFNHQIRFNNKHDFNNPFGKNRSCFNLKMRNNLEDFCKKIASTNIEFTTHCFTDFDFSKVDIGDFVYLDPPYLITQGTYNDGKRGFKGWGKEEEIALLQILDDLDKKGINFGLSNVLEHHGKENSILKNWINHNKKLQVHYISKSYANSNYQKIEKSESVEVLITNYIN